MELSSSLTASAAPGMRDLPFPSPFQKTLTLIFDDKPFFYYYYFFLTSLVLCAPLAWFQILMGFFAASPSLHH